MFALIILYIGTMWYVFSKEPLLAILITLIIGVVLISYQLDLIHKKLPIFVLALVIPFLSACATSWQGRSERDLINEFGLPAQKMESADTTIFQYSECNGNMTVPVGDVFINNRSCKRRMFTLKDHVVVNDSGNKYH